MTRVNDLLEEKGLRQVEDISEIVLSGSFIVDTLRADSLFAIYPVTSQLHYNHDMLHLFGTHWAYSINERFEVEEKIKGDEEAIYEALRTKTKSPVKAKFCFTQKCQDQTNSLWIFKAETQGWVFYNETILTRYNQDHTQYKRNKAEIIRARDAHS